jgi:YidC/Oxa1 family membrane protein insertase
MFFSQKFMSNMNTAAMDPAQKAMLDQMGKMMPVMITATFIFVPIPAGVLLYMVVSNIIQVAQTIIINKQLEAEDAASKVSVVDSKTVENAKNITPVKEK